MNTFVMGDKGMEPCKHTRSDGKPALETRDNEVYCTTCGLAVLTVATLRKLKEQLMAAPHMSSQDILAAWCEGYRRANGLE